MKTQIINLKGGAKLLFNRQTEINGICLEFTFKAGSLNDPMGKLGVAHFCEHALCDFANAKMTKKERSSYSRKFQYRNAYTSNSNMGFSIRTVDEDFEDAVDFVTESFASIKYLPEDFEEEQRIISDEIKTQLQINRRITPYITFTEVLDDKAYNNLVASPAGKMETFNKITLDDLKEFISKYITLNNLIISVCGNIKKSKVVSIMKKYVEERLKVSKDYGYDKREIDFTPSKVHFAEAIEKGKSQIEITYDLKRVPFSYDFVREQSVSTILRAILQEKTFEYFRTEHNLCYGCSNYVGVHMGHLINEVCVYCQEENMQEVIEKFDNFISTFSGDISKELFDKHKKKVIDSFNFDIEDIGSIARSMLNVYSDRRKIYNDKYKSEWQNELQKVTYEEVNEIYKMLFTVKPHIILVASKEFEKFDFKDITVIKE